jgi:hypothetical protein
LVLISACLIFVRHLFAISIQSLATFLGDPLLPARLGCAVRENAGAQGGGPEHVEIVDFAENILHVLEIVAPGGVLLGQEILHDVAEALDADA